MNKKNTKYKQCGMRKRLGNGNYKYHTAWIPAKFAIEGKMIKIGKPKEAAEDGWEVVTVGNDERLASEVENKGQRDSLRSIR